jgi:hypothetical protein
MFVSFASGLFAAAVILQLSMLPSVRGAAGAPAARAA